MDSSQSLPVEATRFSGPNWVFELAGNSFVWRGTAESLYRAARVITDQVGSDNREFVSFLQQAETHPEATRPDTPSLWNAAILLYGLSLENLLKGLLLFKNPDYIADGKLRGPTITSHDLCILAAEADVALSEDEAVVCAFATDAIYSWGRYPIPIDRSRMNSMTRISAKAFAICDRLFNRVHALYEERFHGRTRRTRDKGK